jgi:hypothetical protein
MRVMYLYPFFVGFFLFTYTKAPCNPVSPFRGGDCKRLLVRRICSCPGDPMYYVARITMRKYPPNHMILVFILLPWLLQQIQHNVVILPSVQMAACKPQRESWLCLWNLTFCRCYGFIYTFNVGGGMGFAASGSSKSICTLFQELPCVPDTYQDYYYDGTNSLSQTSICGDRFFISFLQTFYGYLSIWIFFKCNCYVHSLPIKFQCGNQQNSILIDIAVSTYIDRLPSTKLFPTLS